MYVCLYKYILAYICAKKHVYMYTYIYLYILYIFIYLHIFKYNLHIFINLYIEYIPHEILSRGEDASRIYQAASAAGTRNVNRAKLILVGPENVDKKKLIQQIVGQR